MIFIPTGFNFSKLDKFDYLVHYDIPADVETEKVLFSKLQPTKVILFLEEYQKEYLALLDLESKEIPFYLKQIPKMMDKVLKWVEKNM
jgi:hypothetical protein